MSWDILHHHFYRLHHSLNHLQILKVQRKPIGSVSPKRPGEVNTKDTYIQYHNHHHTIQSLSSPKPFFSARHAISSWGEQLWVLKSSSKLNRFPASRPTSTRPSGLVWSLGMVWLAILAVGCSSAGVLETFLWWIGFNCSSGLVLLIPYMCNNNLMITGSRREPRSLRAGIQRWPTSQPIWIYRLLPCLEVIHYVAPPKIKSTDDFASRIEARSARAAIGQVGNYLGFACDGNSK